jgi:hypothetical protein
MNVRFLAEQEMLKDNYQKPGRLVRQSPVFSAGLFAANVVTDATRAMP